LKNEEGKSAYIFQEVELYSHLYPIRIVSEQNGHRFLPRFLKPPAWGIFIFNTVIMMYSALRSSILVFVLCALATSAFAQTNFFTAVQSSDLPESAVPTKSVKNMKIFRLQEPAMRKYLKNAPLESQGRGAALPLEIPLPNGKTETFGMMESPVLSPEVAARHPEIKTYTGNSLTNPKTIIRLSLTASGFNAILLNVEGDAVYFEAYAKNLPNVYFNYFARDAGAPKDGPKNKSCGLGALDQHSRQPKEPSSPDFMPPSPSSVELKTFRLAMAANAEFTAQNGGTALSAYNVIVDYVNRMNAVYRKELGVHLNLVSDETIVYTNAVTDPYDNDDQIAMLTENHDNLNTVIGSTNYDIGHVWGTAGGSGGGVATFESLCSDPSKGRGVSGEGDLSSYAQVFMDQLLFHEVGHQFGMSHSYNSSIPVCTTRRPETSVEPGSGATIMSYGFTCGTDDYFFNGNPQVGPILQFHAANLAQANAYINNPNPGFGNCYTSTSTSNLNLPVVTMPSAHTIPKSTPFALTGSATDADGDALTYCWEGMNIGTMTPDDNTLADPTQPPFFRTYGIPDSSGPTRIYPLLAKILDGSNYAIGDKLPSVGIATTHRLTVRDNNAMAGGVSFGDVTVTIDGSIGPFLVTNDFAGSYPGNSTQTLTWSVNGTNAATPNVKILLSTDGGLTFPTVLLASTSNDGTQAVTLPNTATSTARIKVESVGNIFFDISNVDFTITPALNPTCPADFAVCINAATFALTGGSPAGGTYSGTGVSAGIFNPATAGAGPHIITYTNGGSCTFTITVNAAPTSAAGPDQTICTSGTATLAATATNGTGAWTVVTGPSTSAAQFSSTTSAAAVFTPAGGAGTYTLRWTVSNAPCTPATDDVDIVVNAAPTSAAGPDQTICISGTATLAATATNGTGAWTVVTGPSTSAAQFSSTTSAKAVFTPAGGAGTYTLRWTVSNAPCPPATDDVVIVVNASPTSAAGPDQTTSSTATLAATATNGTGAWTVVTGPSTSAAQFSNTTSAAAVFTPAGGAGTYTLRWTVSNAPCPPATDDVAIIVTSGGPVTCPTSFSICSSTAPFALTGGSPAGGTYSGPGVSAGMFNPAAAGAGTHTITYTNGSSCTFTVTVTADTQPPTITCPANQTKSTDPGQCQASVTYTTPTATDNCTPPPPTVVWVSGGTSPSPYGPPSSTSTFQKGVTIVQWKATDGAGLTKTCTFRVTVNDNEAPTMNCPTPINVNTTPNQCSAVVTYSNPTFTDNCLPNGGTAVRISGLPSGSAFPAGTHNVVFRATDAVGLTKQCTMTVTVMDAQAPTISCPPPVLVTGSGTPCKATVIYSPATATDNCTVQALFLLSGLGSGSSFPAGVTTNTWRAIANNGQSADCSFTVTVGCGTGPNSSELEVGSWRKFEIPTTDNKQLITMDLAPNPATAQTLISITGLGESSGVLTVFDLQGRAVWQQAVTGQQPNVTLDVSEKKFAAGVYFVTLRTASATVTKRLMKTD